MDEFEEGYRLLEEKFGRGRDNLISLATIAREPGSVGAPCPAVRGVDAFYEEGIFYVSTNGKSNKMLQIEQNPQVSIASTAEMFTASGIGENLGWVLDPKNSLLRDKLRAAFSNWYDMANNENDRNCCILAIRLTRGILNINHWEKLYHMDFINRRIMKNGDII